MLRWVAILIILGSTNSLAGHFCKSRKRSPLNSISDDSPGVNDQANEKLEYDSDSLERLLLRVEEVGIDNVPDELRDSINKKIMDNGPSDIEMKLNIMGITPLTLTGFTIAFIIILFNNIFGNGWATKLFNSSEFDDQVITTSDDVYSKLPVSKEVIDRIIKSHDEYLKEKVIFAALSHSQSCQIIKPAAQGLILVVIFYM